MPSVGTAYVNIRVNTKSFTTSLDSVMARLSKQMEAFGTDAGRSFERGLAKSKPDKIFDDWAKSSKTATDSIKKDLGSVGDKMQGTSQRMNIAANGMVQNLKEVGTQADDTSKKLGDLSRNSSNASRSISRIGAGGGGGGGLRTAGDNAGFFSARLRELISEAPRGAAILQGLYSTAAFGGTALAGAASGLSAVAQGVFAVGANAAAAAPALAIFGNSMVGLAQIGGTIGISLQGVGDAISAGLEPATAAAGQAAKATDGVNKAAQAAARGVRDAKDALQDAYRDAARAAEDAARRTMRAEQALAQAQRETLLAQRALNSARKEGLEQLEDIAFAAEDAALAERRASLDLQDAYAALQEVSELPADNRARMEAQLAFEEAELNLRQAKDAREDANREQRDAARTGVEGTDAMIDAHANVADAKQNEADAARDLADARREEARVAIDNADRIAEAQQNVADAQLALADAQKQGTIATTAGTAAVDKFAQAMENLSGPQQRFVNRLIDLHDNWVEARKEISKPLFRGLNDALTTLLQGDLLGQVKNSLIDTSDVLGDFARRAARMAESPAFQTAFVNTLDENNESMRIFGRTLTNIAQAFVEVTDAAGPTLRRFARWTERVTDAWTATEEGETPLESSRKRVEKYGDVIDKAADRMSEFWDLGKELWNTLQILGGAADKAARGFDWEKKGVSKGFIPGLTDNLKSMNDTLADTGKNKEGPTLVERFDQALHNMVAIGDALGAVFSPLMDMGQDPRVAEAFGKIADNSDAFDTLGENANDALVPLADLVVNVSDLLAAVSESGGIQRFVGYLADVAGYAADLAGSKVGGGVLKFVAYIGAATAAGKILWSVFKIGAAPIVNAVKGIGAVGRSIKNLPNTARTAFDNVARIGRNAWTSIQNGWTRFTNLFRKTKLPMKDKIPKADVKDEAGEAKAKAAGTDMAGEFAKGLRAGKPLIEAAMESIEATVRQGFIEIGRTVGPSAKKIGIDLMKGLASGIRAGTPAAKGAALKAGRDVADDIGDGAGTHSPSTITMKDGNDIMEGLELGIKSGTAEAKLAATTAGASVGNAVGNSAKTAAATSTAGLGTSVAGGMTGSMGKAASGGKFARMGGIFTKALTPLKFAAKGFGAVLTLAMGPFGIILELLPLIIPLIILLEKKFGIFSKTGKFLWEGIKKLGEGFKWLWDKAIKPLFAWIADNAGKAWDNVVDAFNKVVDAFGWLWDKIKEVFGWLKSNWPLILGILTGPIGLAVVLIIKYWDKILNFIKGVPGKIKNFLRGVWNIFVEGLRIVWDKVKAVWGRITDWVKGRPAQFKANLKALWNIFKDGLNTAYGFVKGIWTRVTEWIKGRPAQFRANLAALWDVFKDKLDDIWETVKSKWESIKTFIGRWPGQITNILSGLWDGITGGLASALNGIGRALNGLIDKFNDVTDKFGGPSIDFRFKTDYSFAEGGPVRGRGGPKSDSILARLSNGEHVLTAREVTAMGGHRNVMAMRKAAVQGGTGGFLGWAVDKVKDIGGALKKGAEYAIKWAIDHAVDLLPSGYFGEVVKGWLRYTAEKFTGWGESKDEEIAKQSGAGSTYKGPPGGWTYPLTAHYTITQMPNAGHNPSWSVDIGAPSGTGVRAATRGVVKSVIDLGGSSYGKYIVLSHAHGEETLYAHLRSFAVKAGQAVKTGQIIGYSNSTGHSTGPHLHFEVRPSSSTYAAMAAHGVRLGHGGVVAPSPQGTLAVLAEAGAHERVTPLDPEGFTPAERRIIETLEAKLGGGGDQYNVYPSEKMDETRLADLVARRVRWQRRRGRGR